MTAPFRRKDKSTVESEVARLLRQFVAQRERRDEAQRELGAAKASVTAGAPELPDPTPLYRQRAAAVAAADDAELDRIDTEIATISMAHDEATREWNAAEPQLSAKIKQLATVVGAMNEGLVLMAHPLRHLVATDLCAAHAASVERYMEFARSAHAELVELRHLAFELRQLGEENYEKFDTSGEVPLPAGASLMPQNPAPDGPHAKAAARVRALREAGVLDALRLERAGGPAVGHTVRGDFAERV